MKKTSPRAPATPPRDSLACPLPREQPRITGVQGKWATHQKMIGFNGEDWQAGRFVKIVKGNQVVLLATKQAHWRSVPMMREKARDASFYEPTIGGQRLTMVNMAE